MGSSTSGKKHKKDKKHRHRDVAEEDVWAAEGSSQRQLKHHKKHREHKEQRHRLRHRERVLGDRDRRVEVIAVQESDSDSSDCVEVPVDATPPRAKSGRSSETEGEISAPPPPHLTKHAEFDKERERRDRDREREREREHERVREREREKEKEREREHYERERRRERDMERERYERERMKEREREQREQRNDQRHNHQRERERDRERGERHRERPERIVKLTRSRSHSPVPDNGAGDCLSVEETNKLRAKLGLKPLEMDTGPSKSSSSGSAMASEPRKGPGEKDLSAYKDEWGEFLHKPADNIKEKEAADKLREKLKQRKEKRFLEERLARIRTLGESDDETDDISKWVVRNKKVIDQKKEAAMREKALEEMDAEFGVDELVEKEQEDARRKAYNDKHLKGLRVEHDMEDFSEGRTVILTLKDKDVLNEEDGDTLVNVNMIDDERYRKNVANKKLNPLSYGYDVYEEQYDELGNAIERNILEKYDEDIDGKAMKKKDFVIGQNVEEQREHRRKLLEIKTKLAGKRLETLADAKIMLASDTFTEAEIAKFKKPKRKVKKQRQKLKADDLVPLSEEAAEGNFGSRRRVRDPDGDDNDEEGATSHSGKEEPFKVEVEEEDLQRALSKARKLKQKENIIQKPLHVPDMDALKQEIKSETTDGVDEEAQSGLEHIEGSIVLNATAEFCRTLGDIPTYGMAGNRDDDSNDMMDYEAHDAGDEHNAGTRLDEIDANHGTWNSVNPDEAMRPIDLDGVAEDIEEVAILDEEPDVGAGVANALRLAMSKGYLEKEEHNRPSNSKMAHLQAKNYSIEDKSTGDDDKFGRRDRFHSGPIQDFKDKETFKPNVKLDYIDDNGRILTLKEAFRYLSHKFHGKGPGKNKIEKRLKKMEQDGLMKTMSSTDTPLGTLTMLQQKQKETKTPYVVLSGGKATSTSVGSTSLSKYK